DFERIRGVTFVTATAAALAIVPAAAFGTALLALTLAGLALVATAVSVQYWRQLSEASALEREVLAEAGATSYLAFQIQRVNGLGVSGSQRRQLVRADEALRASLAEWRLLAGDVGVEWALEHREAIGDANRRLRAAAGIRSAMVLHLRPE